MALATAAAGGHPIHMGRQPKTVGAKEVRDRVGQRVQVVRVLLGVTQKEAGALIELTQGAISKIESGKNPLEPDRAITLATNFGVTLDFLYGGLAEARMDPAIAQNVVRLRPDLISAPSVVPFSQRGANPTPRVLEPAFDKSERARGRKKA